MIKNYMEQVIDEILPDFLKDYTNKYSEICLCEKCINDIKCIALNNLKPSYFTTEMGYIYLKLDSIKDQYKSDIINEITKATKIVFENKRH